MEPNFLQEGALRNLAQRIHRHLGKDALRDGKLFQRRAIRPFGRFVSLKVRREVMGAARVASSMPGPDDFAYDLQRLATEMAWAEVWTREGLDRRSRSIATDACA